MYRFFIRSALLVLLYCVPAYALQSVSYDPVTFSRALAVKNDVDAMAKSGKLSTAENEEMSQEVYSPRLLNGYIEENRLFAVVRDKDRCQFTPDIEDRARIIKLPAFMFAWGDMLINGVCVVKDEQLGLSYIRRAADNAYAPALERLSFYYENGFLVPKNKTLSERYMHTSAVLGSKNGRLGWADMLVRGYGAPSMYAEAFSWLYHSFFRDEYLQMKKNYLEKELQKRLPPDIAARNRQISYDY